MTVVLDEDHIDNLLNNMDSSFKLSLYKRLRKWYLEEFSEKPATQLPVKTPTVKQEKVNSLIEHFTLGILRYSIRNR